MDDLEYPRKAIRYPLAVQRGCDFCLITFKDLAWKDHAALLKDISATGVGIATEEEIERGFVWFKERVSGYRSGVLLWSRQLGERFRAGIQFAPLTRGEEQFIAEQVESVRRQRPLDSPHAVIATIMGSLQRND